MRSSRYALFKGGPKGVSEERLDAFVIEPGTTSLGQPTLKVLAQRPVSGERGIAQSLGDEGPDPRAGAHKPVMFELAICLEHGVRIDRKASNDVFDRRQLVALAQEAETEGLADLVDHLKIGRDARRVSRWNSIIGCPDPDQNSI